MVSAIEMGFSNGVYGVYRLVWCAFLDMWLLGHVSIEVLLIGLDAS